MVKNLSPLDQNEQALTNVPTPINDGDAANKLYVDTLLQSAGGGSSIESNITRATATASGHFNGAGLLLEHKTTPSSSPVAITSPYWMFIQANAGPTGEGSWYPYISLGDDLGLYSNNAMTLRAMNYITLENAAASQQVQLDYSLVGETPVNVKIPNKSGTFAMLDDITGGDVTVVEGATTKLDLNPDPNTFGMDTAVFQSTRGNAGVQMVSPSSMYLYANTGLDAMGLWDTYLGLGLNNAGIKGTTLQTDDADGYNTLTAPQGVRITKTMQGENTLFPVAKIKVDNITAERTFQLPDASGVVATQEYVAANGGGGGSSVAFQATAPADTTKLWIDTDENIIPLPRTMVVSATQPTNPQLNDLWVDIS